MHTYYIIMNCIFLLEEPCSLNVNVCISLKSNFNFPFPKNLHFLCANKLQLLGRNYKLE